MVTRLVVPSTVKPISAVVELAVMVKSTSESCAVSVSAPLPAPPEVTEILPAPTAEPSIADWIAAATPAWPRPTIAALLTVTLVVVPLTVTPITTLPAPATTALASVPPVNPPRVSSVGLPVILTAP